MRKILLLVVALRAGTVPLAAFAQSGMIDGEITKVDHVAGKITIKSGPIKKLGMDTPHTMVWRANDPSMLTAVKAGDKVKFEADQINGQYTVTKIRKAN